MSAAQNITNPSSNTILNGSTLAIALGSNPRTGTVTNATFTVTGQPAQTISIPSQDQYPSVGFEVNVVGPDNGANSEFSSGAGTITYGVTSGQRCIAGQAFDQSNVFDPDLGGGYSAETSNVTSSPINPPCCGSSIAQGFKHS